MTTINVKDAAGSTVAVARVADTGQAAAGDSLPVVLPAAQVTTLTPPAAITGFATAAKQPALGTAGAASADVISVQGIASGTALAVSVASLPLPSSAATETSAGAAATSLAVMDDWDESDRAKVNPISGQAGVAAGAGAVSALVQRVTLASDDPAVARLTAPSTGTQTSVASSASDGTILASNAARKGAVVFNDDANALLLLLSSAACSATVYTVQVASGEGYELPVCQGGVYTGVIKGLWLADGTGSARVTELT